jgi:Cu+-exporting ATPase
MDSLLAGHDLEHKAEPAFGFVQNALDVPLAAGVLYASTGLLPAVPDVAAPAMSLSSASVVTNALRLGRARM